MRANESGAKVRLRHGLRALALVVIAAGLLAACGTGTRATSSTSQVSSQPSATTAPPVGSGYIATGSNFVEFIQWNDNEGNLAGSVQAVSTSGQSPNLTTTSNRVSVTGSLNGSSLSLSFDGGALAFGTLSGGSFTLNIPQSDGTLAPVIFRGATAAQFNDDVTKLNGRINQANQAARDAQALQQKQQTINGDASQVASDMASLSNGASDIGNDVQSVQSALTQVASALATTQALAQQVSSEAQQSAGGNGTSVCGDAQGVDGNAQGVDGNAQGVEGNAQGVQGLASRLRTLIQQLNSDFTTLQSDEAKLPGYSPPNPPSQSQVSQAASQANASIASALSTTNGYISGVPGRQLRGTTFGTTAPSPHLLSPFLQKRVGKSPDASETLGLSPPARRNLDQTGSRRGKPRRPMQKPRGTRGPLNERGHSGRGQRAGRRAHLALDRGDRYPGSDKSITLR